MRLIVTLLVILASATTGGTADAGESDFARYFSDETLRVDYFHVGDAADEMITIDRLYRQGKWAGPRGKLVDTMGYGGYRVSAFVADSDEPVFAHGYDSYFGEYRTTDAAANGRSRVYHETVLLPFPKQEIRLLFEAHRRDGSVITITEETIDPADLRIASESPAPGVRVIDAHVAGDDHQCLDIAILGEGYTADEEDLFRTDLEHFAGLLLATPPYSRYRDHINIRGAFKPAHESGCDEPTHGKYRHTPLGVTFYSLGSERYVLTEDNRALRDIAANLPYDALTIMVNHDRYGGGGIYNFYCTFTAHNQWSDYLLLHEFGHSFGGLADEYYTSSVAYNDFYPAGREPEEPNITALLDPNGLKWQHLVSPGMEIPTRWEKADFDARDMAYQAMRKALNQKIAEAARDGQPDEVVGKLEAEAERLSKQAADAAGTFLAGSDFAGKVGAFEGAGYSSEGLYRPMLDCIMFSKGVRPFCTVCEAAVARMIERYTELEP